jgi:signal transduction histidine kinase
MDSKRHYSPQYFTILKNYYQEKYADKGFDLIISTDNNAYDFLLEYRDEIFGKIPTLFCGVNSIINPPESYTGVFENLDIRQTLEIIRNNHPNFSEIVFVTDHSNTGDKVTEAVNTDLGEFRKTFSHRWLKGNSIADLQHKLAAIDKNAVVLFLLFNRDEEGRYFTYEESFSYVEPYCKVPIYCVWDFYLTRGAIGGAIISASGQGRQVGQMAKKIIAGTSIDRIPVETAQYENVFDYEQMVKWEIDKRTLPNDSRIINVPYQFFEENKEIVILTIAVLILLVVIIVVMSINIHIRKLRAEKESKYTEEITAANRKLELAIEEAQESNRLKSAFLANMSHEIRTPMNSILGFTELLAEPDVSEENRINYVSIIQKNTSGLLRVINDILDISKIETNQLHIEKEWCDLEEIFNLIAESFNRLYAQYDDKVIDFRIKKPETNKVTKLFTDSIRLQQVLTNLLENAVKFTSTGHIFVGYEVKEETIMFYVEDTGIGIPENKQKIIFDRFRQVNTDAKIKRHGGTGLGLAISKSLVELLGGTICMKSKEGEGTTFYFTIPMN